MEAQLRILNGKSEKFAEEFVTFIKELLSIESNKILNDKFISDYKEKLGKTTYFKIARNIEEWVKYISEKQFRFPEKKSLCLAGYCKPVKKANDYEFIKINSNGDSLKWSMDGEKFRNYANKSTEVGNVYDIHGFDIDFASIYIGKDIYLDEEDKCIKVNKDNSFEMNTSHPLHIKSNNVIDYKTVRPFVALDYQTSAKANGNNVDAEVEAMNVLKIQMQYQLLSQVAAFEYNQVQSVLK